MYEYLDKDQTDKILKTIHAFETGSSEANYSSIAMFDDGPNDVRQITFGSFQATQGSGLLGKILRRYDDLGGSLVSFDKWGRDFGDFSLVGDREFIFALRKSGSDPLMKDAQDQIYLEEVLEPAFNFCLKEGLTLPLSHMVVVDSYIHSGGVPSFLRKRFKATTPTRSKHWDKIRVEKSWIIYYLLTRRKWLKTHRKKILQNTVYRVDTLLDILKNNDWYMKKPFKTRNGVFIV